MGIRWQKQFDDQFNNSWRVDVLDSEYSSGAQTIELSREEPFLLEQRNASMENFGLRSTFFTLEIQKAPEDVYDIVRGSSKGRFEVEILKNGSRYYRGVCDPSLVQADREFGPETFVLEGDDFSELKDFTGFLSGFFDNGGGMLTDAQTALSVFSRNVQQIGGQELHTVVETIHAAGDGSNDPLEEYGFWDSIGQVNDASAINKFDLLNGLCKRFNFTLTWAGEATYYLEEWTEKDGSNKTKYAYDLQNLDLNGNPTLLNTNTSYSQSVQVDDVTVQREPRESRESKDRNTIIESSTDWRLDGSPNGRDFLANSELRSQIPQPWNGVNTAGFVYLDEVARLDNSVSGAASSTETVIEQTFDLGVVPDGFKIDFNWRVTNGGADNNGDNAYNFTVIANDNWALNDDWISVLSGPANDVEEEGETKVKFALPTNGSNFGYSAGTIVLPKSTELLFPWAKVKLKENLVYGGLINPSAVCEVSERETNENIRNAYGLPSRTDSDPLLKNGQEAKILTWLPYPTNDFGSNWKSIQSAEYQSRTQEVPLYAPDGTRISGSLRAEIRGYDGNMGFAKKVEWASFRIRPIGGGTDYRIVEQNNEERLDFSSNEDEASVLSRGEFFVGTTPKDTRAAVIDMDTEDLATDWGSGLKLEEVTGLNLLKHAATPIDERRLTIRSNAYSPELGIELDGDVHLPKQLRMNPVEGEWSGRFFKFDPKTGLNVVYDRSEGEETEPDDDQPNNANTGTVVQPQLAPEVIASYLESEKDVLRLSGDLIEFNGASEFTEYLVSDDYDGDLPDSNGNIASNGTTGFIIKDAYFDSNNNLTSASEMIITNATIRDTIIEDGVDIGTGNFTGTDILLNSDFSGSSPSTDAFLGVERGTQANAQVLWDESSDQWKIGTDGNLSAPVFAGANETITGNWEFDSTLTFTEAVTDGAATGFSGSGTYLSSTENWMDNLTVRETIFATEFEKKKYSVSKGTQVFSVGGGKVESIVSQSSGSVTIEFQEDPGIQVDDYCLVRESNPSDGTISIEIRLQATSKSGTEISFNTISRDRPVQESDDVVVVASPTTGRDSLLTANPFTPAFNALDNINNFLDWDNRSPNVRVGNLDGISDTVGGQSPSGSGLYGTDNVYLGGNAVIEGSVLVQGSVSATEINSDSVLTNEILANSAEITNSLTMGSNGIITNTNNDFKISQNGFEVEFRNSYVQEASFSFFDSNDSTEYGAIYGDRFIDINSNTQRRINIDYKNGSTLRIFDSSTLSRGEISMDKSISINAGTDVIINADTLDIQTGTGRVDISGELKSSSHLKTDAFLVSGGYDQLPKPTLSNLEFTFIYDESLNQITVMAKDSGGTIRKGSINLS